MLHSRYWGIPGRPPAGCLGGFVARIYGPFGGILAHDGAVCTVVRRSSARREDVPICRSPLRPAFLWRANALSANARRPQSFQGKLAGKKKRQSLLESVGYVSSEKALASPPRAFATPATPPCWSPAGPDHRPTAKGSGREDARWGQTPKCPPIGRFYKFSLRAVTTMRQCGSQRIARLRRVLRRNF